MQLKALAILGAAILICGGAVIATGRLHHAETVMHSSDKADERAASSSGATPAQPDRSAAEETESSQPFDIAAIPLGDGKVSTSPKVGYVYSCQTAFRTGGASHDGGWIHGDTWNLLQKAQVEGKVYWDSATFSNTVTGLVRALAGNGLPVNEPTGTFPIARTDPAWEIDHNPNSIEEQNISYSLTADPKIAPSPSCIPMGPIGIALNGVAIYNALDEAGRDAVAHEVQDLCDGHPQSAGEYHYHGPSSCMPNAAKRDTVVGYALDGFPITSMYGVDGQYYTDADLDACHGTSSTYTDENGTTKKGYHYVLTQEYPYTLGCFMGSPVRERALPAKR
jgi:hypothetical protein